MPTTVNNCVFLSAWTNWADAPEGEREWKTAIGAVVDGSEQRQGLRAAAQRRQSGRITAGTLAKRAEFEAEITDAIASGRACAARIGWSSPVLASTTTTVDIPDTVPIAALDHVVIRIDRVPYPRQVSAIATPSAGVRRLTVAALPSAPAVGERVWPMLFGTPALSRIRSLDGERWDLQLSLAEPIGTGELGASDACTPAPLQETGAGFNLCGHPTEIEADLDVDCGLVKCVLRWSQVSFANAYRVSRSAASMSPRTPVTMVDGGTFSHEVERDVQGWYYVVTALSGEHESAESDEVYVPPTTIEGVMRAVQERLLATEDATHGISPTAIVWLDRTSDSTNPGDYPAEGFYFDDIDGDDARATELVEAINDAILDAWLERYATTGDWTGLAAVADIPRWTRTGLELVDNALITSANWKTRLFEIAAAVCQLEHLVRQADLVVGESRTGAAASFRWVAYGTELGDGADFGEINAAAMAGYITSPPDGGNSIQLPPTDTSLIVGSIYIPNTGIGAGCYCGTYGECYAGLDDSYAFGVGYITTSGWLTADLAPSALGNARTWLLVASTNDSGGLNYSAGPNGLPKPVQGEGLRPWMSAEPGGLFTSPTFPGSGHELPGLPDGAGELGVYPGFVGTAPVLVTKAWTWSMVDAAVCWTRSHEPSAAHWTHYP